MTSQQSNPAGQDLRAIDLSDTTVVNPEEVSLEPSSSSFGSSLRSARAARGMNLESCAHVLKLPVRVLRQLESDTHEGLDHEVYLGSYITKYARHLELDEALVQAELDRVKQAAPSLVATGGISHSRYLLERYATAVTYVVLTAVIVVPMIWFGVSGMFDRNPSRLAPLDARPVVQQDAPSQGANMVAMSAAVKLPAPKVSLPQPEEQPLLASMVPSLGHEVLQPAMPSPPAAADVGNGGHTLSLSLANTSWVEVTTTDGSRLEYGLLPAGTEKTYHSDQSMDVRIGNASGAHVSLDGRPMVLDDFRRANVAHFRVEMQDGKASVAGA